MADCHTTLDKVRRLRKASDAKRSEFVNSIIAAHEKGYSTRAIAEAAGVSHQRVHQIIHGR